MTLPVISTARWTVAVPRALNEAARDEIHMIPGVWWAGEDAIHVPWNALSTIHSLWTTWGAPLQVLNTPDVAMPRPWGPQHIEELADLLVRAGMAPGLLTYGEPFGLADFQLAVIWDALEHGSRFVKEDPGAGKTVQLIAIALAAPLRWNTAGATLIVTPAAVVRQYTTQVNRLTQTKALRVLAPSDAPKLGGVKMTTYEQIERYLNQQRRVRLPAAVVVGWESLRLHLDDLKKFTWASVVYDESQMGKQGKREAWARKADGNMRSAFRKNRAAAAFQMSLRVPHRFAATATPVYDRRGDLYGQLTLVDPYGWGRTAKGFLVRYMGGHQGQYAFVAEDPVWTEELMERMSRVMTIVPKSVSHAELPPTHMEVIYIAQTDLDPEPKGFGKEVTRLGRSAKQGSLEATAQLRELLLQVAAARKRSYVIEDVVGFLADLENRGNGKVLVFTGRHADCDELYRGLQERLDVPMQCGVVRTEAHGVLKSGADGVLKSSVSFALPSDDERELLKDAYMAHPGPFVFVATSGAWGTGLDFQDTDLLAVVMLPPNPGPFVQLLGRVERLGQTRRCNIRVYVGEGTTDDQMSTLFGDKVEDLVTLLGDDGLKDLPKALRGIADLGTAIERIADKCRAEWTTTDGSEWAEYLEGAPSEEKHHDEAV